MDYLIISLFGAGIVLTMLLFWWGRDRSWTAKSKWPAPGEGDQPLAPMDCTVVGTTWTGSSGRRRQDIIAKLRIGEPLYLIHQLYDLENPDSVSVFTERGDDIGALPDDAAGQIAQLLDEERPITVTVSSIEPVETGNGKTALEVRLNITRYRNRNVVSMSSGS